MADNKLTDRTELTELPHDDDLVHLVDVSDITDSLQGTSKKWKALSWLKTFFAPSTAPTFATSITGSYLTASEILITDANKKIVSAAVATYPSLTELTYVKGVTSAIQTQMNLKAPLASPTFTGTVTVPTPFTIGAVSMTATGTELNYVVGVTSAIQTQLDNKQPLDATLTSIAALGTAADKIAYTTGIDTWAETALTAFGRSLIDDADAATGRTTLGVVIGTNVQAYDATLQSISGLGTAADKGLYTTGIDTWAEFALTVAGRALIDDADVAAQRTTLGLVIGTDVQAYHANLASLAGLSYVSVSFVKMTAAGTFALDTIVLGSIATQNANAVSISGGSITGITDLAIADGGTGASTAADARTNLGAAADADVLKKDGSVAITANWNIDGANTL